MYDTMPYSYVIEAAGNFKVVCKPKNTCLHDISIWGNRAGKLRYANRHVLVTDLKGVEEGDHSTAEYESETNIIRKKTFEKLSTLRVF